MSKYINITAFIISFAIGMLFVYLYTDDKRVIYVYPTPETVHLLQYKDSTGTCFHFTETPVECPKKESEISKLPVQA
jgi:hypothetical protein